MHQVVKNFIRKNLPQETTIVNRMFVSAFIATNDIYTNNNFIDKFIICKDRYPKELGLYTKFLNVIKENCNVLSLEDLIELFEFVISPSEKEVNGAVYTPLYIRDYIIKNVLSNYNNNELLHLKIGDLSCGCGGFFITSAYYIHKKTGVKMSKIISNFYGIDIASYSIERTRILLNILCILGGENVEAEPNLFLQNSLEFDYREIPEIEDNGGFDIIVGNPPYVSSSKISIESKQLLKNWSVASTGKTDLYLPFFQVAIESLKQGGTLGYITVNNFYRSLNGRAFRSYMSKNSYGIKIIDFGSEQVFKGRSTYTCICFISKKDGCILYCQKKSKEINKIEDKDYINIEYNYVDDFLGWTLCDSSVRENLNKIETIGRPLGELFDIKNGFATLKNDVYLFTPVRETKSYYILLDSGVEYKIEKEICRCAIKPNILKTDSDIEGNIEYLIFPYYVNTNNKVFIIDDCVMKKRYPKTLQYLECHAEVLKHRDKEQRKYPYWYAYGRTQALNIRGKKLLFPYLADKPYFVLTEDESLLFYNGYAIVSESVETLKVLQRILQSSVFWYYIKHTSKPYGGDYFSLAKNYVKYFGIPLLTEEDKKMILKLNKKHLDRYIENIYDVKIPKDY